MKRLLSSQLRPKKIKCLGEKDHVMLLHDYDNPNVLASVMENFQHLTASDQALILFSVSRTRTKFGETTISMVQMLPEFQRIAWNLEFPGHTFPWGSQGHGEPQWWPSHSYAPDPASFLDTLVQMLTLGSDPSSEFTTPSPLWPPPTLSTHLPL